MMHTGYENDYHCRKHLLNLLKRVMFFFLIQYRQLHIPHEIP